jgi:hypothetical protein
MRQFAFEAVQDTLFYMLALDEFAVAAGAFVARGGDMRSSSRKPTRAIRSLSAEEYVCRVLRRILFAKLSAATFECPVFFVRLNSISLR